MSEKTPVMFRGTVKTEKWQDMKTVSVETERTGTLMEVAKWADMVIRENGSCIVMINRIDGEAAEHEG